MKAEIQELLKQVSGELKELQAQLLLAAAQQNPAPQAGTATDPDLYEAPMGLDPVTGEPLPIHLQTDTFETKDTRPGSGVGTVSEMISSAAPKVRIEEAELAEVPLEERAVGRQVVPPEYRDVFDRLHRTTTSVTSEATP